MRIEWFRYGDWLTETRVRLYCGGLLFLQCVLLGYYFIATKGLVAPMGLPFGSDFVGFYATGQLALDGRAGSAYSTIVLSGVETAIVDNQLDFTVAFFYPPSFIPICALFAILPYGWSLLVWWLAGLAAWWSVISRIVKPLACAWPFIAFGAVTWCVLCGQNGFFVTALIGGALLSLMGGRPSLAGVLFGLATFKPHFLILVPVALMASGQWKALVASGIGALILPVIAFFWFGPGVYVGFFGAMETARAVFEDGLVGFGKMAGLYVAVRQWGGSVLLAYLCWGGVACCAGIAVVRAWWRWGPNPATASVLVVAALLGTPYLFVYDLVLLTLPIAWIVQGAIRTGFLPWERLVIGIWFVTPLVHTYFAAQMVHLSPFMLVALLVIADRRAQGSPGADRRLA